jgi:Lon protease-like protein
VGRPDGTSHLILQGLARVRFRGVLQDSPFRVVEIQALAPKSGDAAHAREMSAEVLELCAGLEPAANAGENLQGQLSNISEPDVLADIVAHTFLRDPHARQDVLEAVPVRERLETLIRHLRTERGQAM